MDEDCACEGVLPLTPRPEKSADAKGGSHAQS
jgi:hypothetical protein